MVSSFSPAALQAENQDRDGYSDCYACADCYTDFRGFGEVVVVVSVVGFMTSVPVPTGVVFVLVLRWGRRASYREIGLCAQVEEIVGRRLDVGYGAAFAQAGESGLLLRGALRAETRYVSACAGGC